MIIIFLMKDDEFRLQRFNGIKLPGWKAGLFEKDQRFECPGCPDVFSSDDGMNVPAGKPGSTNI